MTTPIAFLFPGQGSQAVGMGADIFAASGAARQVFETVDEALGIALSDLCFHGPEETLRETINAQPAIVTVSLALLAAFQESLSPSQYSWTAPLAPGFTAGHSVGEYAALVVSGALDLRNVVRLVRERGRLMHHEGTVCPGGMAAVIGMEEEPLHEVCRAASDQAGAGLREDAADMAHPGQGKVAVANLNAPGQVVISGELRALDLAMEMAKARGAKRVIPLAVSGAFHSPVMQPAAEGLAGAIKAAPLSAAAIPIIGNINARPLTEVADLQVELAQQVAAPVQWTRSIEYLANAGVRVFLEIGPGQALTGMVRRIAKGATTINIGNVTDIEKAASTLQEMDLLHRV